ncbi:hypothetical protein C1645_801270 [Glomus cerebriforme]|uniref:Phosphatidylglycerol/phosphatidylinositol transfer protein n=1 Tax=Glomus cerebriforme TaxID=658196 RepID=A0A397TJU3_9GLOM|nr:hypothetical protein C1645_801270 [Glomus cerebriforme]
MNKFFSIIFIFILFTTSSSNLIPRQTNNFQVCDSGKTYPVTITKLTFTPNPIVVGQVLALELAGTTQVQIQQNTILQIQGIIFVPVFTYKVDFCNEVLGLNVPAGSQLCPIPAGNFDYNISVVIPNDPALKSLNGLRVRNTLLNPDGTELICLEGPVQIS